MGDMMVIKKTKVLLTLLLVAALVNVASSQAVMREGARFAASVVGATLRNARRFAFSRPGVFAIGGFAALLARKNLLVSPKEKKALVAKAAKDHAGHSFIEYWRLKAIEARRNVARNSRDMYNKFDKQQWIDRYEALCSGARNRWVQATDLTNCGKNMVSGVIQKVRDTFKSDE